MNYPFYAVITGDVRKSTMLPAADLVRLPMVLKEIFNEFNLQLKNRDQSLKYSIFRGDSFQLVTGPANALQAALFVRAGLRSAYPTTVSAAVDCRLAIAIGNIRNLSDNITESIGEAFTQSGRLLENMKKPSLMAIHTPSPSATSELNTELALCDELVRRWTHSQALLVPKLLNADVQMSIADDTGISQPAIAKKLQAMGWQAIDQLLLRYREICQELSYTNNT